jgi:HrpA-like RNA helicase
MMLLQASGGGLGTGLIFVAQPRRIAAYSLYTRAVSMGYGDIVGLRMGQDTRVEGPKTRLFYVTTGYLARMASHHPEAFERVSHLILDECHERSIEADVLCVMARQLLRRFRTLRVVLMSATVHTEMYVKYFAAQLHASAVSRPLHVGGARFPITVLYLDAVQEMVALPDRLR